MEEIDPLNPTTFDEWWRATYFYVVTGSENACAFCPFWVFTDWIKGLSPREAARKVTDKLTSSGVESILQKGD